jgi:nitrogen regulatory protein P-II 2
MRVAVSRDQVGKVTDAIARAAKTGEIGDVKIFVLDLDNPTRLLAGETEETVPRRAA